MADAWDRLADYRDAKTGDRGDLWHRALIDPALRRLIGRVRGLRVLEVACGNGYLAREFARRGAREVVGVDRSRASIRLARRRDRLRPRGVVFEVGDAGHLRFADGTFDLVVANMALMDIPNAAGAIREAARVLVPGGRFLFSISHPCFDLDDRSVWSVERGFGSDGLFRNTVWRSVRGYRDERESRSPWRVDPHTVVWTKSFHRTLSTYVRYLRDAGFAVTAMDEPLPQREMLVGSPQGAYLQEIPLHLVVEAVRRDAPRPASRTPGRSRAGGGRRSGSRARIGRTGSAHRGSSRGS
jgi:SAM-dependent methyltransferase